jgi:hypothetical protein
MSLVCRWFSQIRVPKLQTSLQHLSNRTNPLLNYSTLSPCQSRKSYITRTLEITDAERRAIQKIAAAKKGPTPPPSESDADSSPATTPEHLVRSNSTPDAAPRWKRGVTQGTVSQPDVTSAGPRFASMTPVRPPSPRGAKAAHLGAVSPPGGEGLRSVKKVYQAPVSPNRTRGRGSGSPRGQQASNRGPPRRVRSAPESPVGSTGARRASKPASPLSRSVDREAGLEVSALEVVRGLEDLGGPVDGPEASFSSMDGESNVEVQGLAENIDVLRSSRESKGPAAGPVGQVGKAESLREVEKQGLRDEARGFPGSEGPVEEPAAQLGSYGSVPAVDDEGFSGPQGNPPASEGPVDENVGHVGSAKPAPRDGAQGPAPILGDITPRLLLRERQPDGLRVLHVVGDDVMVEDEDPERISPYELQSTAKELVGLGFGWDSSLRPRFPAGFPVGFSGWSGPPAGGVNEADDAPGGSRPLWPPGHETPRLQRSRSGPEEGSMREAPASSADHDADVSTNVTPRNSRGYDLSQWVLGQRTRSMDAADLLRSRLSTSSRKGEDIPWSSDSRLGRSPSSGPRKSLESLRRSLSPAKMRQLVRGVKRSGNRIADTGEPRSLGSSPMSLDGDAFWRRRSGFSDRSPEVQLATGGSSLQAALDHVMGHSPLTGSKTGGRENGNPLLNRQSVHQSVAERSESEDVGAGGMEENGGVHGPARLGGGLSGLESIEAKAGRGDVQGGAKTKERLTKAELEGTRPASPRASVVSIKGLV